MIDAYSIKDITIQIEKETKVMNIRKGNYVTSIDVDLLEKQPAQVFKLLLQMMEYNK